MIKPVFAMSMSIVLGLLLVVLGNAFVTRQRGKITLGTAKVRSDRLTRAFLVKLKDESKAQSDWDIHLLEREDVGAAADLALECFYTPRIVLNFDGMAQGSLEYKFWTWVLACFYRADQLDVRHGN